MLNLERSILWTIMYFDIFDYPLTNFEIYKWLFASAPGKFDDIVVQLNSLLAAGRIESLDGHCFLPGRRDIVARRRLAFQISKKKIDRAKKLAKLLQIFPYTRGIFLCNKVAQGIATEESDIDFFVISASGRIWTTRFLTIFWLKIFGLRPSRVHSANTFCFSFYVSSEDLALHHYMLPAHDGVPDIHYIYWLSAFLPLWNGGAIKKFAEANDWIKNYLPNFEFTRESSVGFSSEPFIKKVIEWLFDMTKVGSVLEKLLRKFQRNIMPQELVRQAEIDGTNVIISDLVLKFHINDRREAYRQKFIQKTKSIEYYHTI